MRVLTVCGAGLGTGLLLRMYVQDVFDKLGMSVEIEATDVSSAKGIKADLIVTSLTLVSTLEEVETPIVAVKNVIDRDEIEQKLRSYFQSQEADSGQNS